MLPIRIWPGLPFSRPLLERQQGDPKALASKVAETFDAHSSFLQSPAKVPAFPVRKPPDDFLVVNQ